jgi:cold shock CspA family protein
MSSIVESNPELQFESSSTTEKMQNQETTEQKEPAEQKETTSPSTTKTLGVVKWFDSRGGFGFITILPGETNAGKDIFVHYSSLSVAQSQYKYLVLGEYVEFVVSSSDNEKYEFSAKEVSGVRGGNLMCESRRLSALESRPDEQQTATPAPRVANATMTHEQGGARVGGEKHYRSHDANLIGAPGRRLPMHMQQQHQGGRGPNASAPRSYASTTQDGDFIPVVTRKRSRRVASEQA